MLPQHAGGVAQVRLLFQVVLPLPISHVLSRTKTPSADWSQQPSRLLIHTVHLDIRFTLPQHTGGVAQVKL